MVVVNDNHLSTVPQSRSLYTQLNNSSPEQVVDHTNFVMDKQKNQHVPQEQRKERLNIAKYNKKKIAHAGTGGKAVNLWVRKSQPNHVLKSMPIKTQ